MPNLERPRECDRGNNFGSAMRTGDKFKMAKVAVIVPNYNHAPYLPQRIESILDQNYDDFELLILDDKSPDNSRDIIERYRSDHRVQVQYNETNSGSTYQQWTKGIDLTSSEYIWIAESDDYADPTLLGRLVEKLDTHPRVGIAICESIIVDESNKHLGVYSETFKMNGDLRGVTFPPTETDFVQHGCEYCQNFMVPWNTIPNASAVLFRRSALQDIGGPVTEMRICGDWFTYCKILMRYDISWTADPLNFFRRHGNNVRTRTRMATYMTEQRQVRAYVAAEMGFREPYRHRTASLMFESQLILAEERRPPHGKVPLRRLLPTLTNAAKYGPGLFASTLGVLAKEQAAAILQRLGMRRGRQ
jgi:glycosyltransferase involved in cell wall biosynthesis